MSLCINPNCTQPNHPGNDASRFCQSCGASLVLQERYRVMRLLSSQSGFGQVYEVYERNTPKLLKVLKDRHNENAKAIELFEQEAMVLMRLHHPGIPKVETDGCFHFQLPNGEEPLHCIIMEKIDGLNLSEWMRQQGENPISEKQALNWLRQLADILHIVHQENFFHRDIKPENIMLRSNGQLVLVDFGAAREMTSTYYEQLGATGGITKVSSTGYTPPEQERGQAVLQSDFYALGCTFIYLLTGKKPTDPAIYDSLNNELKWRQFTPHISTEFADLIDCMTAARASDRPSSTTELVERISSVSSFLQSGAHGLHVKPENEESISNSSNYHQSSEKKHSDFSHENDEKIGTSHPNHLDYLGDGTNHHVDYPSSHQSQTPPNGSYANQRTRTQPSQTIVQPSSPNAQRLWMIGLIAALVAALVSVLSISIWNSSQPERSISENLPSEKPDTFSQHSEHITELELSPDQQTLASGSDDTSVVLWGMVDQRVKFVLQGHESPINALAFSPNNRYLASAGDDLYIKIWNVETGTEVTMLPGHTKSINDLIFTSDGERLISASADGTIKAWDWQTGEEIMMLDGHDGFLNTIALSPDSMTLASGGTDMVIKLWDLETGAIIRELPGHTSFVNAIAFSPDGQKLASASADKTIRFWDFASGDEIQTLDIHDGYVNIILFSPDGNMLVSGSADHTIKLWNYTDEVVEDSIEWVGTFIDDVAVKFEGPTWQVIAGGMGSQDIQIWKLQRP